MAAEEPEWATCSQEGCIGIQLPTAAWCLAHGGDKAPEAFDAELKRISSEGTIDARGVGISTGLMARLLNAMPHMNDRPTFTAARFDLATFLGTAVFSQASFQDVAWFERASFQGRAEFNGATFLGMAVFSEASFQGTALFERASFQSAALFDKASFQSAAWFEGTRFQIGSFSGASFHGRARFTGASFQGTAEFGARFQGAAEFDRASFQGMASFPKASFQDMAGFVRARFQDKAWFVEASFQGDAWFDKASFRGAAVFVGAVFKDKARFSGASCQDGTYFTRASFQGEARFDGVTFKHRAMFGEASFERAQQLGPMLAHRELVLDRVQFTRPVQIEAAAIALCCRGASFEGGVQFRLRWARVALDDTDLSAPCILTYIPELADMLLAVDEEFIAEVWRRLLGASIPSRPRLRSLRGANVAGLSLAGVDLADCRFGGAHNLDKLRFEADVSFGLAPSRLAWDTRQVIADERAWRAQHSRRWTAPGYIAPAYPELPDTWLGQRSPSVMEPAQIAGLYRMLRKSREDSKDEPGAADFYYGEMEMRRRARRGRRSVASRGRVERGLLTAYWLVSGYGLRAWRAVAWLLIVLLTATAALQAVGFVDHRESWSSALLYTAGAVTRLVNPPEGLLTELGQAIRLMVGVLGPILLALTLLAVRGRVKR